MRQAPWTRREFLRRSSALIATAASGPALFAACGNDSGSGSDGETTEQDTLARAQETGSIRVGFANDPPWSFADESGDLTGFGPDIADVVFKQLGIDQVEGVLTEFDSLIPGLNANRFDAVTDMFYIDPERCQQVLFSDPLICVEEGFAVAQGNPFNIERFEDVAQDPDIRLGVLGGSAEPKYAKAAGVADEQIVTFNDLTSAVEAVGAGRADAVAYDVVGLGFTVEATGTDAIVTPAFEVVLNGEPQFGCAAYIFKKSDTRFVNEFNEIQSELIASGEAGRLIEPYAGDQSAGIELAQQHSVEELCS